MLVTPYGAKLIDHVATNLFGEINLPCSKQSITKENCASKRKVFTLTSHNNILPEMISGTRSYILSKRIGDGEASILKTVDNKSIKEK